MSRRTSVLGRFRSVEVAVGVLLAGGYRRIPRESRGGREKWPDDSRTFECMAENLRPPAVRVRVSSGGACLIEPCEWVAP